MNEQQLADLLEEYVDGIFRGEPLAKPDLADDLRGLFDVGSQLSQMSFQARPAAQVVFQGQLVTWFGSSGGGLSPSVLGIPKNLFLTVGAIIAVIGAGIGLIGLSGSVGQNTILTNPNDRLMVPKATGLPTSIIPEAGEGPAPGTPQVTDEPLPSAKPTETQPQATSSQGDLLPSAPPSLGDTLPSATPIPTSSDDNATDEGPANGDGTDQASDNDTDEGDSNHGTPEMGDHDRGHGNDPDGHDESNPGNSSGLPGSGDGDIGRGNSDSGNGSDNSKGGDGNGGGKGKGK